MAQRARRFRNAHFILAISAGLIALVAVALGGLGWRLLKQEEALQRQQARDVLEGKANILQTQFFSRMAETETLLRGLGSVLPAGTDVALGNGAVVVALKTGVQVQPSGQLVYLPSVLPSPPFDEAVFAEANRLEFQTQDLNAASEVLSALAERQPKLRAEALLRLARIHKKNGRIREALATSARLVDEKSIKPVVEAPYGLLSRLQRVEYLNESGKRDEAQREAVALIESLDAGQWAIDKGVYSYYYELALGMTGRSVDAFGPPAKLAIAETVALLWDEWRQFQRSGSRSLTKPLHQSGPVPVLTLLNANPERLVAVIYAGNALRHWIPDPATASETSGIRVDLASPEGRLLLGEDKPSTPSPVHERIVRSLSPANLQLVVTASDDGASGAFATERRNYLILVLVVIVLMVALACYAMARGVLREAAVGQLQSDFVSAVSHEFRSPLTTLRQLTELLAEGRIVDEGRRRQYFNVLQKETSRLHRLVEDLLDFGRMDAGRGQYRIETLDLAVVVNEVVQQYEVEAGASGHAIEVAARQNPLMVDADREALQRVVRNLLENAVKYSPDSKTVWVETDREGPVAILRVKDQGIGIPAEERKRVFEKFVRGEAAKKAAIPGTGIGLAMVQEIVRVHYGEVDLTSEVGVGSTFMVRLPLSQNAGSPAVQEPEAVHGGAR